MMGAIGGSGVRRLTRFHEGLKAFLNVYPSQNPPSQKRLIFGIAELAVVAGAVERYGVTGAQPASLPMTTRKHTTTNTQPSTVAELVPVVGGAGAGLAVLDSFSL